jgi:hypothetical protein
MRAKLLGLTLLAGAIPALALAQGGSPYSAPSGTGTAVYVEPVSGVVRIRGAAGWETLRRRLPLGDELIDARRGRVRVVWVDRVIARGGIFDVIATDGVLTLRLRGGSFERTCAKATIASRADSGKRSVRRLWADGHGRFRTRGRYSAATVRGTRWLVEDRCEGTITEVARGEVEVEDFTVPPDPTPTPAPSPSSGQEGQPAPAAAPQAPTKDSGSKPRRVRIKRGQRYIAGPAR